MAIPKMPLKPAAAPSGDLRALGRPAAFASDANSSKLDDAPNEPFFLRHHPGNWLVSTTLKDPVFLPELTVHPIAPGAAGIRTISRDEDQAKAYERALQTESLKGWTYLDPMAPIPDDCLPEGVAVGGYLREYDVQDGRSLATGKKHVEVWFVPVATLPGEKQRWSWDRERYEKYLAWLVQSGQIAPPIPAVQERLRERLRVHVERVEALNIDDKVRARMLEGRKARLEAAESAKTPQPKKGAA